MRPFTFRLAQVLRVKEQRERVAEVRQQQALAAEVEDQIGAGAFRHVNKYIPALLRERDQELSQCVFTELAGQQRGLQVIARPITLIWNHQVEPFRRTAVRHLVDLQRFDVREIQPVEQSIQTVCRMIEREQLEQLARRARHRQLQPIQPVQQVFLGLWYRI